MKDETEQFRRARQAELNREALFNTIRSLEERYGKVWDTAGLSEFFEVKCFLAPYVVVREKATGKMGSLEFQHSPRLYFNWREDS